MYCFAVLNLQPEGAYRFHPENDQRSVGSDGVLAGGGEGEGDGGGCTSNVSIRNLSSVPFNQFSSARDSTDVLNAFPSGAH